MKVARRSSASRHLVERAHVQTRPSIRVTLLYQSMLRRLPSRTGDPILRFRLDRAAPVGEVAPYFLPHGAAYLLRQCCKR